MKIRKAKKSELKETSELFKAESAKKPYFQKWTNENALKKINDLSKKGDIYIVIEKKIIGIIVLEISVGSLGKNAYVHEFWLKSDYQGKGLGKKFMKFIENKYKKKGVQLISLTSNKTSKAFGFYKKLKYKPDNKYILMEKKLK